LEAAERGKAMKCQSDYDADTDTLLRQANDCLEEYWQGEPPKNGEASTMPREEDESSLIVKREVRKRGFVEVAEEAGS